ncbi:MAG TPA: hypothetical protein VIM98_18430 [Dyella sp.]|uniref:hypothetical protein n=1 Tax=Dyella sp. TaxID=1869338 RepID=UPI002F9298E5
MRTSFLFLFLLAPIAQADATSSALNYFEGTWLCEGSFPASGKTIASTMSYEVQGGKLTKHHDDIPPHTYHAVETWNYAADGKPSHALIHDSFSGDRHFESAGWQGDTLTWVSAAEVKPAQRFVYVKQNARTYRIDWEVSRDGKSFVVGDTLICKRQ